MPKSFAAEPEGFGLTTAQILYRVPDFRNRVQEYLWQDFDCAPEYPRLKEFLTAWKSNTDGDLLSVTITQAERGRMSTALNSHFFLLN